MSLYVFCFFNDTATTEIYTYGHTLSYTTLFRSTASLTAASSLTAAAQVCTWTPGNSACKEAHAACSTAASISSSARRALQAANARAMARRSEEHTSELQSLMRNSYAVFCLKKKNNTNHTHNQNTTTNHT